jgi:enoyl-CoA hydratase/carnithine racemase
MPVHVHADGHILRIEIDRPEVRNALDWDAFERITEAWKRLAGDDALWVGVVTATGDRVFCAGVDLWSVPAEMERRVRSGETPTSLPLGFNTVECTKPWICAINGDAVGGGFELALACDLRIAADHARFWFPEVRFSGVPNLGGTQRLPRVVGTTRAAEIMMTARKVPANEAAAIGILNRVVPAMELVDETQTFVEALLSVGPLGLQGIKEAMQRGMDMDLRAGIEVEQQIANRIVLTDDFAEGLRAYRAKEPVQWKGR